MLRKIVDYKKLSHGLAAQLIETYPDGYGDDDIIAFRNASGEIVEAVELRTNGVIYLVKISKSLAHFISNFDDSMGRQLDDDPTSEDNSPETSDMELEVADESDFEDDLNFD